MRPSQKNRSERIAAFSLYSENLYLYAPDLQGLFACPICRKLFDRSATEAIDTPLALAHIHPKSLGGVLTTLSCARCDNGIGGRFEKDQVEYHRFHRAFNPAGGSSTVAGRVEINGRVLNAKLNQMAGGAIHLDLRGSAPPEDLHQLAAELLRSDGIKWKIEGPKIDAKKVSVSQLHSAFLMMFAEFGYEYAMSERSRGMQAVLMGAEAPAEDFFVSMSPGIDSEFRVEPYTIAIVREPVEHRCIVVALPPADPLRHQSDCIFLPGFDDDGKAVYESLMAAPNGFRSLTLSVMGGLPAAWDMFGDPKKRLVDPAERFFLRRAWYDRFGMTPESRSD